MQAGDAFLIPGSDDHLWMIISDPSINPQKVVVVCFLSWTERYDQACEVRPGEHPFVKHPTLANYPGARIVTDAFLEEKKAAGELRMKQPLSAELLTRVRDRAASSEIPSEPYAVLREQGFVS